MILKRIQASKLKEFVFSTEYSELENLPISRHRALSHIKNPRASHNDVVLILAYSNLNKLIGYIGVLADYIEIKLLL